MADRQPADARLLQMAIARGLLPPDASLHPDGARPWPLVLLTALGAWLATLPLLAVVGVLLLDLVTRTAGPYGIGALLLALAITLLRRASVPIFVEQLAVPALGVGVGLLTFGFFRDLPEQAAAALLAGLLLALAWAIPRAWLRALLGAAAAGLAVFAGLPLRDWVFRGGSGVFAAWLAIHLALAAWAATAWAQDRPGVPAALAAAVEAVGAGWLLALLALLAWWSGMTFLVGGVVGNRQAGLALAPVAGATGIGMQLASVAAAAAGCAVIARAWPSLRATRAALAGAVLLALAWCMPALGAALFVLAGTAATQRWRLAGAAAVAVAWIIGAFYYQLDWSLAAKAGLLLAAGVALGLLALAGRLPPAPRSAAHATLGSAPASWILAAGVLTLAGANHAIWQKETVIAEGQRVLVPLAPVDPRSLMAGDYMQLQFVLPPGADTSTHARGLQRPHVVAVRDASGVARLLRMADATLPLAPGEFHIQLTPRQGRWTLVSDAWHFREGDGDRWAAARYGEFRVDAQGRALLVGLADRELKPIQP